MMIKTLVLSATVFASVSAFAQQTSSASTQTPAGTVTVNTHQVPAKNYASAPAFDQLARGGAISPADADAYPALADDFIHADRNRDGRVSKAEYERWLRAN